MYHAYFVSLAYWYEMYHAYFVSLAYWYEMYHAYFVSLAYWYKMYHAYFVSFAYWYEIHFIPVGQRDEFNISFLAMCVGKKTQQYLSIYMYMVHLNGSDINPTMKIPILSIADLC
jgi:hypothetical protein